MTVTLDQRIAASLQLFGRATWREIARLLGTSESTVARRARAMMAAGIVRTTAVAVPLRCGLGYPVLVLCRVEPDATVQAATELAKRADARFLVHVTGRVDLVAELIVTSRHQLATVLLHELPTIPGLVQATAEHVLRTFKTSYDWSRPLLEQCVALPDPALIDVRAAAEPITLDDIDLGLIDLLREDGRQSYQDLASAMGISESAARRHVDQLIGTGCVVPVTLVDPTFFGYGIEALVFIRVDLSRLEEVAEALVARPEVRYLSATSGQSDLAAEVILRSEEDLYDFRTSVLGRMKGIRQIDVALELRTVKRAYLSMESGEGPPDFVDGA
jgi:DNA-binding Lrp family transcriptional regulator